MSFLHYLEIEYHKNLFLIVVNIEITTNPFCVFLCALGSAKDLKTFSSIGKNWTMQIIKTFNVYTTFEGESSKLVACTAGSPSAPCHTFS